jgi:hypothetical protein
MLWGSRIAYPDLGLIVESGIEVSVFAIAKTDTLVYIDVYLDTAFG